MTSLIDTTPLQPSSRTHCDTQYRCADPGSTENRIQPRNSGNEAPWIPGSRHARPGMTKRCWENRFPLFLIALFFLGRAIEPENRFPLFLIALFFLGRAIEPENRFPLFLIALFFFGRAIGPENRFPLFLIAPFFFGRAIEPENRFPLFLIAL